MAAGQNKAMEKAKKSAPNKKKLSKEEKEKQEMQEAMTKWTQMQTVYLIPLMVGFGAYSFTAGLGVYWMVQNVLAIIQTILQYRHSDGRLNKEDTVEDFKKFVEKVSRGLIKFSDNVQTQKLLTLTEAESKSKSKHKKDKKGKKKKNRI